jgi:Uma2 family endonuclease
MSILSQPHPATLYPPTLPVYRFSVDQYQQMIEAGVLKDTENVELLEGLIVPKMSRNPRHDLALELCDEKVRVVLPAGWRVRIQSAIATIDSMPEPDLAVVRGHALSRRGRHPDAKEVGMIIEVSEASLDRDRTEKARLYARSGIEYYWIVNLIDNRVEIYTNPTGPDPVPRYQQRRDAQPKEVVPVILGGVEVGQITVADLLP